MVGELTGLLSVINSLKLCWFHGTTSNSTNSINTFTLPQTYNNTNYAIVVTAQWKSPTYSSSNGRMYACNVVLKSVGTCKIHYVAAENGGTSYITNFDAIAIGY